MNSSPLNLKNPHKNQKKNQYSQFTFLTLSTVILIITLGIYLQISCGVISLVCFPINYLALSVPFRDIPLVFNELALLPFSETWFSLGFLVSVTLLVSFLIKIQKSEKFSNGLNALFFIEILIISYFFGMISIYSYGFIRSEITGKRTNSNNIYSNVLGFSVEGFGNSPPRKLGGAGYMATLDPNFDLDRGNSWQVGDCLLVLTNKPISRDALYAVHNPTLKSSIHKYNNIVWRKVEWISGSGSWRSLTHEDYWTTQIGTRHFTFYQGLKSPTADCDKAVRGFKLLVPATTFEDDILQASASVEKFLQDKKSGYVVASLKIFEPTVKDKFEGIQETALAQYIDPENPSAKGNIEFSKINGLWSLRWDPFTRSETRRSESCGIVVPPVVTEDDVEVSQGHFDHIMTFEKYIWSTSFFDESGWYTTFDSEVPIVENSLNDSPYCEDTVFLDKEGNKIKPSQLKKGDLIEKTTYRDVKFKLIKVQLK